MNMNFKLNLDLATATKLLKRFGPSLAGLAVVGIFGYTGWVINEAFNVKPAETIATEAAPKVGFDKTTINSLKNVRVVPGQVVPTNLGKSDPFGN